MYHTEKCIIRALTEPLLEIVVRSATELLAIPTFEGKVVPRFLVRDLPIAMRSSASQEQKSFNPIAVRICVSVMDAIFFPDICNIILGAL